MYTDLVAIAGFAFLFSLIAGRLEKTPITGPIVFITFGLLFGPLGTGWLHADVSRVEIRVLADLTLAIFLFVDAANVERAALREHYRLPLRMLLLGLPGAIVLGFVLGFVLFDSLSLFEIAALAVMLAATDAALGKGVATNPAVPGRIRFSLNVESGLNDGLCVPLLLLFIALAKVGGAETDSATLAFRLVVQEIGIGLIVGAGLAAVGARLLLYFSSLNWISGVWAQLPVIMLALTCFAVAQSLHGSGYIAAFVGGLVFRLSVSGEIHTLVEDAEGLGETLAMLTWVTFGVAVVGIAAEMISWEVVVYAVLSLTLVRILPIYLSLVGTGETVESRLFMGWFGPRGLASIVFAIIVLNNGLKGGELMVTTVIVTVSLSALLHGVTANPLANRLATRLKVKR